MPLWLLGLISSLLSRPFCRFGVTTAAQSAPDSSEYTSQHDPEANTDDDHRQDQREQSRNNLVQDSLGPDRSKLEHDPEEQDQDE